METLASVVALPPEMTDLPARPLVAFSLDVAKPQVVGATPGVDRRAGRLLSWAPDGRLVLEA